MTIDAISHKTSIQIGLLVAVLVPAVTLTVFLVGLRADVIAIRTDISAMQTSLNDRWTYSMQQTWSERLEYRNTNGLIVPAVSDVYWMLQKPIRKSP